MMHVSWTTLREQIFAKLRRPYRSEANMNEVGHDNNRPVHFIKKALRKCFRERANFRR
jgi:hypothetical protein